MAVMVEHTVEIYIRQVGAEHVEHIRRACPGDGGT